jgi:hypothetical protein
VQDGLLWLMAMQRCERTWMLVLGWVVPSPQMWYSSCRTPPL